MKIRKIGWRCNRRKRYRERLERKIEGEIKTEGVGGGGAGGEEHEPEETLAEGKGKKKWEGYEERTTIELGRRRIRGEERD